MTTLHSIKRRTGIAGQFSLLVDVEHEDGRSRVEFVGNVNGGPVVMILESGAQTFVTEPERFGRFGEDWVRRFFA